MATKNFEVLDGMLVEGNANFDSGTLFVDSQNNRIGVGKTNPATQLDVNGTITATTFSGSGSSLSSIPQSAIVNLGTDFLRSNSDDSYGASAGVRTLTFNNSSVLSVQSATIRFSNNQILAMGTGIANVHMTYVNADGKLNFSGSNVSFDDDLLFIDTNGQKASMNVAVDTNSNYLLDIRGDQRIQGSLEATGDVVAYASDERLKTNIRPIENALEKIDEIGAYIFEWDEEKCEEVGFKPRLPEEHGVLAQEVEKVAPDMVVRAAFNHEYKTAKYEKLSVLLLAAVKELKEEIRELKSHLTE